MLAFPPPPDAYLKVTAFAFLANDTSQGEASGGEETVPRRRAHAGWTLDLTGGSRTRLCPPALLLLAPLRGVSQAGSGTALWTCPTQDESIGAGGEGPPCPGADGGLREGERDAVWGGKRWPWSSSRPRKIPEASEFENVGKLFWPERTFGA